MRKFLFLIALVLAGNIAFAQVNTNEAKAAYQLAEESYAKGDYKSAMEYLQQAKTSLGTANCKLLYLAAIVARELYPKDLRGTAEVLSIIDAFEKSPDYKDFNEEKVVEVSKLKLVVKGEQKKLNEEKEKKALADAARAMYEKAFDEEHSRLGPFDITLAELEKQQPDWEVKKWKNFSRSNLYIAPGIDFDPKIPGEAFPFCSLDKDHDLRNKTSIAWVNPSGKIKEYRTVLVYTDKKNANVSPAESLREANYIIESYRKKLGPEQGLVSEGKSFDNAQGEKTIYKWLNGHKGILLCRLYYPSGNLPIVKLIEIAYYDN